ncbi:MAG: hypothetical protein C4293_17385 [Nitrospiraceae bacterium]
MISQTSKTLHLQPGSVSVEGELQSQEIDLDDDALVPATGLVNGLVMGTLLWLALLNLLVVAYLLFR